MESAKAPIWVTGASGMLGRTLLKTLKDRGQLALGVSRRPTPGGALCDLADSAQVKTLFKSGRPSLVINAAAYSDVDGCERDPKTAYESNTLAVKNLSEVCGAVGTPWIQVSTDYVFDGRKKTLYSESDRTAPVNIYGLTKEGGEYYAAKSASSCAIVRTSWLFGAENPANFVNAILARLKSEKELSVLDDQTDCPTHVKDLSAALLAIGARLTAEGAKNVHHELYQVCNQGAATRHEMTVRMNEWLGSKARVQKTERSQIKGRLAVRPPYVAMSPKHFEDAFRMPMRPWQESLKEYVLEVSSCAS